MSQQTSILKGVSDEIWIKGTARVRQDDGRHIEVPFRIQYRMPTRTEIREVQTGGKHDDEVVREFILGWDLPGADGQKVEFNDDNLAIALEHPDYLAAFAETAVELLFGKDAVRAKNSASSGPAGRAIR